MTKLVPCVCGGTGIVVDAEPSEEYIALCEQYNTRPFREFAVKCDKCGKQTHGYNIKSPAYREWNRINTKRPHLKKQIFNKNQKAKVLRTIARFLKAVRDEYPNDEFIRDYAKDLYFEICLSALESETNERADKK